VKFILTISLLTLYWFCSIGQDFTKRQDELKNHIYTLASDSMQGRAVGSSGIVKARQYIESQFRLYNLKPAVNNQYLQNFKLIRKHKNSAIIKIGNKLLFNPWNFYYKSGYNHNDSSNIKIVFAGYGDDKDIAPSVSKKHAIAFYSLTPLEAAKRITQINKLYHLQNYFVTLTGDYSTIEKAFECEMNLSEFKLPDSFEKWNNKLEDQEWYKLLDHDSLNVFFCFKNVFNDIFGYSDKELIEISDKNNRLNFSHIDLPQPQLKILVNYNDSVQTIPANNIIGIIEGKDTSKTVVVSAHYDHIGVEFGKTNYGADDNASGTSALLQMAKDLNEKYKQDKPLYNIMFISFSAEELGLLGSEWYVNHPVKPIANSIIDINLDMIGRFDDQHLTNQSFVYLLCKGQNKRKTFALGRKIGKKFSGFDISKQPGYQEKKTFLYGSDHYNFYIKNIPVAVFFTGLHRDYHTYRDTPDKINYQNLSTISQLALQLADHLANTPSK
jgi:hypothetical protein